MPDGNLPAAAAPQITDQIPAGLASFLAPLQPYCERADVIELCINRPQELFIESYDGWKREQIDALTFAHLSSFATTVATFTKQSIGPTKPILSGTLPGGERIQIVIPPAVPDGTISITIRKPSERVFSLEDYDASGMFDAILTGSDALSDSDRDGQPASVEMSDAEIANPETIMPERLKLDHSGARAKLEALRKSGNLTSRDGTRDLLSAMGVELGAPEKT